MATERVILAGKVVRHVVRKRTGPAGGYALSQYQAAKDTTLQAISLELAMAPDVSRLRLAVPPDLVPYPWRWRQAAQHDDVIDLVARDLDDIGMFAGFLVESDWGYQAAAGGCELVAVGLAQRMLCDSPVYGRYMRDRNGELFHATGLAGCFNQGGKPNRSKADTFRTVGGIAAPLFTYDGDPDGQYWSAAEAVAYLLARYNIGEAWLSNPTFTAAQTADKRPIRAEVEGQNLWEALAAVAKAGGYDLFERYSWASGGVVGAIAFQKKDAGGFFEIRHAKPATPHAAVDLRTTNSFSARVAESVASAIAAPVVLGACKLTQTSFQLQPVWTPGDLSYDADSDGPLVLENDQETTYASKYVVGGSLFESYALVGRLWDANTDGRYDAVIPGGLRLNVGQLVANRNWPDMPHRPLPLIDREIYGRDSVAYWSHDGGASTHPLKGFTVMDDRLGIYITQPNLADLRYGDKSAKATQNLFYHLVNDPTNVRVYLICSIAHPTRTVFSAARRRKSAGTLFSTSRTFDRGQAGGVLDVRYDPQSPWAAAVAGATSKAADNSKDLAAIGASIQDACEARQIEASFEIPWPETDLALGMRVREIGGIGYSLRTNTGAAVRYPRIVRLTYNLTPDTYDVQICLDTDRQAGVV